MTLVVGGVVTLDFRGLAEPCGVIASSGGLLLAAELGSEFGGLVAVEGPTTGGLVAVEGPLTGGLVAVEGPPTGSLVVGI